MAEKEEKKVDKVERLSKEIDKEVNKSIDTAQMEAGTPPETTRDDTVLVDKKAFDELLKKVEDLANKPTTNNSYEGYPLIINKPDFINKKGGQYSPQEVEYYQKMSYYEGYPQIRAGRVETTGRLYDNDDTYKSMLRGNAPICMCGNVKDLDSLKSTAVLFVPHRGAWVCQSAQCEQQYHRRYGGFERLVSRMLFARDTPYYGLALPDKNDPCTRRGIYPDTRLNEYNF